MQELRKILAALACAMLSSGCAYSLIVDGAIDPVRLERLSLRTAHVRGVAAPEFVEARTLRRAELPVLLAELIREEYSAELIASMQRGLEILGLWPVGRDYVTESLRVSEQELAGIYVPERRTLFVVEDFELPLSMRMLSALAGRDFMREAVLTHEIVHAYQHRDHPGLFEVMKTRHQNDLTSALQAAVEGDATRYGFAALVPDATPLPDAESFRVQGEADLESPTRGVLSEAPALLRLTLAFPYTRGYALSLVEGPELLSAPPAATEQVLHADRRREPFWAIDLAPLERGLPAGCVPLYQDTLGELGTSVLLRDLGGAVEASAWEGWDGDRFVTAQCEGSGEFLWWTEWDSDADAAEFAAAYAAIAADLRERAGHAEPPRLRIEGRRVLTFTLGLAGAAEAPPQALARRARVATPEELLAHFAAADPTDGDGARSVRAGADGAL